MAETADPNCTTDPTLRAVTAALRSVPGVARAWPSRSDDAQVDFYLEWDALMDHLEEVTAAHEAGRLSSERRAAYRELIDELKRVRPVLEPLDLQYPRLTSSPAASTS